METIGTKGIIWVVVKNMVPFWIPSIIRHLISRVPKSLDLVLRGEAGEKVGNKRG